MNELSWSYLLRCTPLEVSFPIACQTINMDYVSLMSVILDFSLWMLLYAFKFYMHLITVTLV